ncbi:unnamed protein product [Discosporangium mesarthrocarpum]
MSNGGNNGPVILNNLPQGDEFMVSGRGETLHLRSFLPGQGEEIKAFILFIHGYGGHTNSRPKYKLGSAVKSSGMIMVQLDLVGHGYSEGERAYSNHYSEWLDDVMQLLEMVSAGGSKEGCKAKFNFSVAQQEQLKKVPFFLAGESLGGGISIMTGLIMNDKEHPLLPRFKGAILIAPAIQGNPPPRPVVLALRYLVAPYFPRTELPNMLEAVHLPDKVWKNKEDQDTAARDGWGNPGGLGWGRNMKFRMALNMLDMVEVINNRLSDVTFPFLVMHDPDDAIVQFGPSKRLAEVARTPSDDTRSRELKEMNGWLHDLLTNCPDIVIANLLDWVLYQLARSSVTEAPFVHAGVCTQEGALFL